MLRCGSLSVAATLVAVLFTTSGALADTVEFADGQKLEHCYVRDEGTQICIWYKLEDVGGPPKIFPRSAIKEFKIERDDAWDAKPNQPDLSVTFIEINPKRASLHGRVQYDKYGRAKAGGAPILKDLGEQSFLKPEAVTADAKFSYTKGEELTLTAHVKNLGFASASPFRYTWQIDDDVLKTGTHDTPLGEMEEATFVLKWKWQEGFHHAVFRVESDDTEIATINNELRDPLWGWSFVFIVHPGRVAAWHEFRSAYGTFSWEDFYRWHVDIMNQLFADTIYPAAPEGIKARVRLDRIVYTDDVAGAADRGRYAEDGLMRDQGAWAWRDREEELKTGKWIQTDRRWRNQTEWSLPHELGHQLGLVDWYALDYEGHADHVWPDNGEKVSHFMRHPVQMMHWHGPQAYGEVDAAYLNMTIDKPRGFYGDMYFTNPRECFLHIRDINGQGLPDATVEIFQRGAVVDTDGKPGEDHGVSYFPVVEDGDFYSPPISKDPVATGRTNKHGVLRLPNRPAKEVRTLNGFHRTDNPFGNMNVVGPRNLMLAKVTKNDRVCYYWLEGHDFVAAWFRGFKDRYVIPLDTPFGSIDSPPPPCNPQAAKTDENHVKVTWAPPKNIRERNYLDAVIGYRVYRRVSNDGMKDRPWFPVATVKPDKTDFVVNLADFPQDVYWFRPRTERFGVTTIGACSIESELIETLLPE